jgi:hypothetical protein
MTPFEEHAALMGMYIDSAKTYLQLSTFALGFSLAFRGRIRGNALKDPLMLLSWAGFMLTVALSSFYQYLAVKSVDGSTLHPSSTGLIPEQWVQAPGRFYAAMLIAFYIGILFLSLLMLLRSPSESRA